MRQIDRSGFATLFVLALGLTLTLALAWGCQPQTEEPAGDEEPMAETEEVEEPQEAMAEETDATVAVAALKTADGTDLGTVTFTEGADGVEFSAELQNVEGAGPHGIHVHEAGECSAPDFTSAGGHFNPEGTDHACPPTAPRHAGDFGNVEIAEDGTGTLSLTSDLITVAPGTTSVVGKAVILHGGEDDCTSQPSGAAGPRIGCGVIEPFADPGMEGTEEGAVESESQAEGSGLEG